MTPIETGLVFGLLLRHREITGNPQGRPLRPDELRAAQILSGCGTGELRDFEEFLNAQGFTLHFRDGIELGIPARAGVPNTLYVLTRKRGEEPAPYLDTRWVFSEMRDRRREKGSGTLKETTKTENAFWVARMWLTLQWFFYQKIDRQPSEVSRYQHAFVTELGLIETLSSGIENMGNAGRPEGVAGAMWDVLWKDKNNIGTWVIRFLRIMERAGMVIPTANKGEFRQTLVAAMDMAHIADYELLHLMPADSEAAIGPKSIELLTGEAGEENETEVSNAAD